VREKDGGSRVRGVAGERSFPSGVAPAYQSLFFGERVTGTGFQIALESLSFSLIRKRNVSHQLPRDVFGGERRFPGIVRRKPLLQIGRNADVALTENGFALEQIDIPHRDIPPPPRLRRASCFANDEHTNPAKRAARSRMVGDEGIEPPTPSV
jgi:hypothetical protein